MSVGGTKRGAYKSSLEKIRWIENLMKQASTDECIIWPFSPSNISRYGRLRYKGEAINVTKLVLSLKLKVEISFIVCALHSCDNSRCINPKHLWNGTQQDNIRDCLNKDRFCKGRSRYSTIKP